jgi:MATE family multidrug resistance protein
VEEQVSMAAPSLGVCLADPLLALVDTALIGRSSSKQLAALGPNTSAFNCLFQLFFAFLSAGTTALIARNSVNAPGLSPKERRSRFHECSKVLSNSLALAISIGITFWLLLVLTGSHLLLLLGAQRALLVPATRYLTIRASATPAVLIISASHGACMGQQDAWTSLKVSAVIAGLNAAADGLFILRWQMGIVGAAWATVFAQYSGALLFLRALYLRGKAHKGTPLEWHGVPSMDSLHPLLTVSGTLLLRTSLQMLAYAMISWRALDLGTLDAATHQVAMQLFWFLATAGEPLSVTAQSLIARDMADSSRVREMARLLLRFGVVLGTILGTVGAATFGIGQEMFTQDAKVKSRLQALWPQALVAEISAVCTLVLDGVCVGSSDFGHLPRDCMVATALSAGGLFTAQKLGWGLPGVWMQIAVFFSTRLVLHTLHIFLSYQKSLLGRGPQPGSVAKEGGKDRFDLSV